MLEPRAARRAQWRRLLVMGAVAVVVLLALGSVAWRKAYGQWLPVGDPPRISACGRTYLEGAVVTSRPDQATIVIGRYPPLVGRAMWTAGPLPSAPCSTAVFLETSGGYRGYGLSGGP